jgi:hypothetical protein
MKKHGKRPDGQQRYRCVQCSKTFSDPKDFGVIGHKQIDEEKALLGATAHRRRKQYPKRIADHWPDETCHHQIGGGRWPALRSAS